MMCLGPGRCLFQGKLNLKILKVDDHFCVTSKSAKSIISLPSFCLIFQQTLHLMLIRNDYNITCFICLKKSDPNFYTSGTCLNGDTDNMAD